jgi:hypothetical protein
MLRHGYFWDSAKYERTQVQFVFHIDFLVGLAFSVALQRSVRTVIYERHSLDHPGFFI